MTDCSSMVLGALYIALQGHEHEQAVHTHRPGEGLLCAAIAAIEYRLIKLFPLLSRDQPTTPTLVDRTCCDLLSGPRRAMLHTRQQSHQQCSHRRSHRPFTARAPRRGSVCAASPTSALADTAGGDVRLQGAARSHETDVVVIGSGKRA